MPLLHSFPPLVHLRKYFLSLTNMLKCHCILWNLSHFLSQETDLSSLFKSSLSFWRYSSYHITWLSHMSAPSEPLHMRDCILYIFASWFTKHVNHCYHYIHKWLYKHYSTHSLFWEDSHTKPSLLSFSLSFTLFKKIPRIFHPPLMKLCTH